MDYADGGAGQMESLAIRFKNAEIANDFARVFDECKMKGGRQEAVAEVSKVLPEATKPKTEPAKTDKPGTNHSHSKCTNNTIF